MNDDIRDKQIRLIGIDGEMLGIVASTDARKMAEEANLDLVKISPNADPPVCKIMDYGKFIFEKNKKEKEAKKNQKVVVLKEIKLSATIDTHDMEFKIKNAIKFLQAKNKVKVSIRFKGREISHSFLGKAVLEKFILAVEEYSLVERTPKIEGRSMFAILAPK